MSRSARTILNEANPNKYPAGGQAVRAGDQLGVLPRTQSGVMAVANTVVLPETAKAARVLDAYSRAGAVTGRFTPVVDPTPLTAQAGINANGDIVFLPADAVTDSEVQYAPVEGPVIEDLIDVAANVGTLLQGRAASIILEVESLVGGATGVFTAVDRGTTPVAGEAAIQDVPTAIEFAAADAVTRARVRYIAQPGVGTTQRSLGDELDTADREF